MTILHIAAVCAAAFSASAFAGAPVELQNAGFEQGDQKGNAAGWSRHPNWRAERGAGHNGSGGLVYECLTPEAAAQGGRPGQLVKLEAGKRYYFSALAKAEGLVTERKTAAQGITVYMEGYNASNKWVFGATAEPCVSGKSRDWVKIEGLTREIPEGVAHAYIQPYVPGRGVGRAVIDNVYLCVYDVAPVEGVYSTAYRHESAGGKVRFSASINTGRANRLAEYSAVFSYMAADGRRVSVPGKIVSNGEASVTLDTSRFAAGTNDVVCTLSLNGKALGSAAAPFARLNKPTPRKVYIDEHLRTIVDGKPFFPLGMYYNRVTESNLAVYAKGPFNCLMPYGRPTTEEMDICHKKGFKVIYNLQGAFNDPDAGEKWVRTTVPQFQNHPALLAWYTNDEHPLTDVPKLTARQLWVEELDSQHPTWSVQDVFSEVRHYLATYDVLGMDPYPIPSKPIETVISSMRQGNAGTFGTRAVWQVPQAFGWGWLKRRETKGQRAPTQAELANMTWQSIAGGANGIVYYAFHHLSEPHDDPADAFEPAWARTKAAAAEVKKYERVLLSAEKPVSVTGATDAIAVRAWRQGGDTYLLIVNCTAEPQKATLRLSEKFGEIVSADFGPAPALDGDRLDVAFGPIGYAMLRLEPRKWYWPF